MFIFKAEFNPNNSTGFTVLYFLLSWLTEILVIVALLKYILF